MHYKISVHARASRPKRSTNTRESKNKGSPIFSKHRAPANEALLADNEPVLEALRRDEQYHLLLVNAVVHHLIREIGQRHRPTTLGGLYRQEALQKHDWLVRKRSGAVLGHERIR